MHSGTELARSKEAHIGAGDASVPVRAAPRRRRAGRKKKQKNLLNNGHL
jgi:hypothetical protein